MAEHSVSAISVVDLARELKRYAVINQETIAQLNQELAGYVKSLEQGEDISALAEKRYPEKWLLQLWRYACDNSVLPEIGVQIGATVTPESHGLLARWTFHSETLKDALQTYIDNIGLTNASEQWEIKYQGKEVVLIFAQDEKHYPYCAVERSIIGLHAMGEYLCASTIPLNKAAFTFPEPVYAAVIQQQLKCPVEYASQHNSLILDAVLLDRPLPHRNHYLRSMLEHRSIELGLLNEDGSLENKVRHLLMTDIKSFSQVTTLAERLHMSRTTLYRKLRKENTSFSEVLDSVRLSLLQTNSHLPATKLAERLGFHDMSAFYKARNRWKSRECLKT